MSRTAPQNKAGRGRASATASEPLLTIEDLHVEFRTNRTVVRAINGVSLEVRAGETMAILGESGSGKSVTFDAVLDLLERPPARVTKGRANFMGRELFSLPSAERRAICGREIGIVFQDPLSSLNPVYTVGWQIAEMLRIHCKNAPREAHRAAVELLREVGIPSPEVRANNYPHQFSGGMRQRAVIAMALAASPRLVIADEPTTALDVTVEAQILNLLRNLQQAKGVGLIIITHSMGVVAEIADRVTVMYAGRVMESGPVSEIFRHPAHPYTIGLLNSAHSLGKGRSRLTPIPGYPPDMSKQTVGCAFRARCPRATELCGTSEPALVRIGVDRASACHYFQEILDTP